MPKVLKTGAFTARETYLTGLLTAKALTREFSDAFTLGPVNFSLASGEAVAFLGKNGAGKTTLFQLLSGNIDKTSGEILFDGKKMTPDKPELKRRIGYLPQHAALPRWVTAAEMLSYGAQLYELPEPAKVAKDSMEFWDCAFFHNKPLAACSHGMQKRVGLALATMHDPDCLILDEPFSGLDLFHIKALEDTILRRQKDGKATIISTHIAPYTAKLCEKVFVLEEGNMRELSDYTAGDYLGRIALIEKTFYADAHG